MATLRGPAALLSVLLLVACRSGAAPLHDQTYNPVAQWPRDAELVVTGHNRADRPVTLVIRVDDTGSRSYASRANPERVVSPGPFALRLPLASLRTPAGRAINLDAVTRLLVFMADGHPAPRLDAVIIEKPPALPDGALGWDLGPAGSAPFPGFITLSPDHAALHGPALRALRRPSGDALLQDGIAGVHRLALPLPDGHWQVTLWTEDLGAWETLPHPLKRTIIVNGQAVDHLQQTPQQWIESRYLAGRSPEAVIDGDAWELHGSRRGGAVTADIEVRDGQLEIEVLGDGPAAHYLAGLLVEPLATAPRALLAVRQLRHDRFVSKWSTGTPAIRSTADTLTLRRHAFRQPFGSGPAAAATVAGAPGSGLTADFVIDTPRDDDAPVVTLDPPRLGAVSLPASLRFGHWRYRRRDVASTLLDPVPDHLRGDLGELTLHAALPRRLTLRVEIPPGTPPGHYRGTLRIASHGNIAEQPLDIEVVAATLPPAGLPIGIYLEGAPHLDWFAAMRPVRDRARRCDLMTLAELGLTSLAPPLATPDGESDRAFIADLRRVRDAGFSADLLAYAPVKRLIARNGPQVAADILGQLTRQLRSEGLEAPVWAIADEPGDGIETQLAIVAAALRTADPAIRLAGQLNRPDQATLLPLLDVALLNAGYGVDAEQIGAVRKAGVTPWFYNMGNPRLAAGFHLWRSGAAGYLQWHGRMPTADPFDPTDGREDDVQLLYPALAACPRVSDLDATLLALAEGITDLRWLRWLEDRAASGDAAAIELLSNLAGSLPGGWAQSRQQTDPAALRDRIIALAR